MNRVLVIGCAGAGKSTVARQVADITGLPLIHLDQHFWRPGWVESDKAVWASKVEALIAESHWIMDGHYGGSLPLRLARADTTIFLDLPRWLCLWRVLQRTLLHLGRTREDMTQGCPERFDWLFFKYIWTYQRDQKPRIMRALQNYTGDIIHCRTRTDVTTLLNRKTLAS